MVNTVENSLQARIEAAKSFLEKSIASEDKLAISKAHAELAALNLLDQRVNDARAGFRKSAKILKGTEAWGELFNFHIERGKAYERVSRIPEASRAYRKAITINREHNGGDANETKALLYLGELLLRSKNTIKARRRLNQAEKLAKKISDEHNLIAIYAAQSKCHLALSAYKKALDYGKRSRDLAIQLDQSTFELEATFALGVVRYLSKDYSGAAYEFEKFQKRSEQLEINDSFLEASEYLCQIYEKLGLPVKLSEIAQAAITFAEENSPAQLPSFLAWQEKAALVASAT